MFAEYVQNIECVLEHYQNAIESVRVEQKDSPMSVDKLKRVISENHSRRARKRRRAWMPTKLFDARISSHAI